jgi:hypothetical protein
LVLTYESKQHIHDDITTIIANLGWANDTPALINFNLTAQKVVLILYSGHGYGGGANNGSVGGRLAINLDAARVAITNYAPFYNGLAWGADVVWLGLLAAGNHTVQGQIQQRGASTQINDRRLLVVIFDGVAADFRYIRDTTAVSTVGTAWVNDPNGIASFNTPDCKALVIYSQSCDGTIAGESTFGKKTRIDVDGAYQSVPMEHDFLTGDAENTFEAIIRTLAAGLHTFTGQFGSNEIGGTVRIHERQLAVLLFSTTLETDFAESSVAATILGAVLGNDAQAHISRNIAGTRYVLAIYSASKLYGQAGTTTASGKKVAVNIDGVDYTLTGQTVGNGSTYKNHAAYFTDVVTLNAGVRTVDGRFSAFTAGITARVTDRTLCVLWFPSLVLPKPKGTIATAAKIAAII